MMTVGEAWGYLSEHGVCEQALQIVTNINGYTIDTLNDVAYAEFGYRTVDRLREEM